MPDNVAAIQPIEITDWLLREFDVGLASAIEALTGERPNTEVLPAEAPPKDQGLSWCQPFHKPPAAMWIVADDESWRNVGAVALRAAGIDETPDQLRSEYLELVRQATACLARAMTEKLGSEVMPAGGEQTEAIREADWRTVSLTLTGAVARITVGFEPELLAAFSASPAVAARSAASEPSKTFELLLDLELPVSISFGRAQVPLKDVLKLTVGSIVELNRAIGDAVEVIVNNCVIARGQVVVIDGNFGVRIQNVISTQERLRTLD